MILVASRIEGTVSMVAGLATSSGAGREVLPTAGFEWGAGAIGGDQSYQGVSGAAGFDRSDSRNLDARDGGWHSCGRLNGEEEFVVFAAVQGGFEGGRGALLLGEWVDGESGLVDLGVDGGGAAEMGQVGGEAVADIEAGGGEIAPEEGFACVDTGFGVEVGMVVDRRWLRGAAFVFEDCCKFSGCTSELASHVKDVAGVGSAAAQGFIFWSGADKDYVRKYKIRWGLRSIAASERDVVEICQAADAV
jgi:hypothetical protein